MIFFRICFYKVRMSLLKYFSFVLEGTGTIIRVEHSIGDKLSAFTGEIFNWGKYLSKGY